MNQKYIKELAAILVSIKDVSIGEAFLHNILTPAELDEISKRLQIVKLLLKGVSQRDVAKKLGVSSQYAVSPQGDCKKSFSGDCLSKT